VPGLQKGKGGQEIGTVFFMRLSAEHRKRGTGRRPSAEKGARVLLSHRGEPCRGNTVESEFVNQNSEWGRVDGNSRLPSREGEC